MMTRKVNGAWETPIDLEATFAGLFYYKCEGLNTKGEPRAYTEEYAEAEQLRIWLPENVTRKATDVVLQLLFKGDARQTSFDAFVEYVFVNLMALLQACEKHCRFFLFLLEHLLYDV